MTDPAPNVFATIQRDLIARMDETARDIALLSEKIAEAREIARNGTDTTEAQRAIVALMEE